MSGGLEKEVIQDSLKNMVVKDDVKQKGRGPKRTASASGRPTMVLGRGLGRRKHVVGRNGQRIDNPPPGDAKKGKKNNTKKSD